MSFTDQVKSELAEIQIKSPCCKKAMLTGLLYNAAANGENISVTLPDETSSAATIRLIRSIYAQNVDAIPERHGAHKFYAVSFASKNAVKKLLYQLNFECEECKRVFFRGLFVASGSINAPDKSTHMEIKISSDEKANILANELSDDGLLMLMSKKGENYRLYCKKFADLQDIMTYLGCTHSIFAAINVKFEKELRNNENRATNCVTQNINRSVTAGHRQLVAIEEMDRLALLAAMPEKLKMTAILRLENPDATLDELAALHDPPITKSGVNHRLEKIMMWYEKNVK